MVMLCCHVDVSNIWTCVETGRVQLTDSSMVMPGMMTSGVTDRLRSSSRETRLLN